MPPPSETAVPPVPMIMPALVTVKFAPVAATTPVPPWIVAEFFTVPVPPIRTPTPAPAMYPAAAPLTPLITVPPWLR